MKNGQMDGHMADRQMDRHTDVQRETIIARHYRVAGYKKGSTKTNSFILRVDPLSEGVCCEGKQTGSQKRRLPC